MFILSLLITLIILTVFYINDQKQVKQSCIRTRKSTQNKHYQIFVMSSAYQFLFQNCTAVQDQYCNQTGKDCVKSYRQIVTTNQCLIQGCGLYESLFSKENYKLCLSNNGIDLTQKINNKLVGIIVIASFLFILIVLSSLQGTNILTFYIKNGQDSIYKLNQIIKQNSKSLDNYQLQNSNNDRLEYQLRNKLEVLQKQLSTKNNQLILKENQIKQKQSQIVLTVQQAKQQKELLQRQTNELTFIHLELQKKQKQLSLSQSQLKDRQQLVNQLIQTSKRQKIQNSYKINKEKRQRQKILKQKIEKQKQLTEYKKQIEKQKQKLQMERPRRQKELTEIQKFQKLFQNLLTEKIQRQKVQQNKKQNQQKQRQRKRQRQNRQRQNRQKQNRQRQKQQKQKQQKQKQRQKQQKQRQRQKQFKQKQKQLKQKQQRQKMQKQTKQKQKQRQKYEQQKLLRKKRLEYLKQQRQQKQKQQKQQKDNQQRQQRQKRKQLSYNLQQYYIQKQNRYIISQQKKNKEKIQKQAKYKIQKQKRQKRQREQKDQKSIHDKQMRQKQKENILTRRNYSSIYSDDRNDYYKSIIQQRNNDPRMVRQPKKTIKKQSNSIQSSYLRQRNEQIDSHDDSNIQLNIPSENFIRQRSPYSRRFHEQSQQQQKSPQKRRDKYNSPPPYGSRQEHKSKRYISIQQKPSYNPLTSLRTSTKNNLKQKQQQTVKQTIQQSLRNTTTNTLDCKNDNFIKSESQKIPNNKNGQGYKRQEYKQEKKNKTRSQKEKIKNKNLGTWYKKFSIPGHLNNLSSTIIKNNRNLSNQFQQSTCPICYSTNTNCRTSCSHYFHIQCLFEWFKRKNVCPSCRSSNINPVTIQCQICHKLQRTTILDGKTDIQKFYMCPLKQNLCCPQCC